MGRWWQIRGDRFKSRQSRDHRGWRSPLFSRVAPVFELHPTVHGLMAATNERVIWFLYLFLFVPCQQINYQAVGSMLDGVSHAGRDNKRREECTSAGVKAARDRVWHSSHRLLTPSAPPAITQPCCYYRWAPIPSLDEIVCFICPFHTALVCLYY